MINDDDSRRDSSEPPPSMARDSNPVDRVDHAVGKARAAMASARDASELAAEALSVSKTIQARLGSSPDPVLGVPGVGLFGVVASLSGEVRLVGSKVDTLLASLAADRMALELAAAARKGSAARLAWTIAGPAISIAVAAFLAWLGGFHR
jgi:hypothetical protein